jgi:CBS domain containing-hemolysin-like protein
VVGVVRAKKLLALDVDTPRSFKNWNIIQSVLQINMHSTLLDAIHTLKTNKINFAIVMEKGKCVGILTLKQIFEKIVLKKFKDDDIRVHIHLSKQVRIDSMMEAKEQD